MAEILNVDEKNYDEVVLKNEKAVWSLLLLTLTPAPTSRRNWAFSTSRPW